MSIEELEKRLDANTDKIMLNLKRIEHNANKIDINEQNIQKNSVALEILKDYKKSNKRLYIALIMMLVLWIITLVLFHI